MTTVRAVTAAQLRALTDRLHPVYRDCFSAPPWNETPEQIADYPVQLARQTSYPGAYGFIASGENGQIAAAVYGWPAPPALSRDNEFDMAIQAAVSPEIAGLLVAPAVVVAELMVSPAHRRQGLGRALLERFVAGRPRAWLATHPEADAVTLYESLGWIRRAAYTVTGRPLVLYTREAPPTRTPRPRSACGTSRPAQPSLRDRRPPRRPY
ncbi:GNAT family N-acetyltransferase [Actinoplanes sp. CA-131856]